MTSATEQAIAATLGSCNVGRYVGLRQGEYWERTENSNYYCGGCGWKVTDHDSYCPECGGALHNATLGSCNCSDNCTNGERTGTCHEIEDEDTGFIVCSECGAAHDESYTAYYCWCCGRRIEQ